MNELVAVEETENLTVDQRIALLRIKATLSVSQEVSKLWDALQRVEDEGRGGKPKRRPGRLI